MSRAARFLRLPPENRRLLLQALAWLAAVRLALWLLPYRRVTRMIASPPRSPQDGAEANAEEYRRVSWAVDRASRWVPDAKCLTQALAGKALLARRGLDAEVRYGVSREPGHALKAHAWLEKDGRVVLGDPQSAQFRVLGDGPDGGE